MKPIKTVPGKYKIYFDKGQFDNWCIHLETPTGKLFPLDKEYFSIMYNIGNQFTHQQVYNDFLDVFEKTSTYVNQNVLKLITEQSEKYGTLADEYDMWMTVIYAGMIAEENKSNAVLKKRVKRLGMYQVLIEKLEPEFAANFSKGKPWLDLNDAMMERGI